MLETDVAIRFLARLTGEVKMNLTIHDILNDHDLRLEESLAADISDQEKIHRMIFENEITENLLKAFQEEQ